MKRIIIITFIISFNYIYSQENSNIKEFSFPSSVVKTDSIFYYSIINSKYKSHNLSINVKSPNYQGKIIIKSIDLIYYLFSSDYHLTENESLKFIQSLLKRKDTLKMKEYLFTNGTSILNFDIYQVKYIQEVNYYKEQGFEKFLDHYFTFEQGIGTMRKGLFNKYDWYEIQDIEYAIVDQLFQWRIYSHRDDNSGYIKCSFAGPNYNYKLRKK